MTDRIKQTTACVHERLIWLHHPAFNESHENMYLTKNVMHTIKFSRILIENIVIEFFLNLSWRNHKIHIMFSVMRRFHCSVLVGERLTFLYFMVTLRDELLCLILVHQSSLLLLQRGPMTSSMPKPWMLFATEPSVSTWPPTSRVWAMDTALSSTARWVPQHSSFFPSACIILFGVYY